MQLEKKQPFIRKEHCKAQRSDSIVLSSFVFPMFCLNMCLGHRKRRRSCRVVLHPYRLYYYTHHILPLVRVSRVFSSSKVAMELHKYV